MSRPKSIYEYRSAWQASQAENGALKAENARLKDDRRRLANRVRELEAEVGGGEACGEEASGALLARRAKGQRAAARPTARASNTAGMGIARPRTHR